MERFGGKGGKEKKKKKGGKKLHVVDDKSTSINDPLLDDDDEGSGSASGPPPLINYNPPPNSPYRYADELYGRTLSPLRWAAVRQSFYWKYFWTRPKGLSRLDGFCFWLGKTLFSFIFILIAVVRIYGALTDLYVEEADVNYLGADFLLSSERAAQEFLRTAARIINASLLFIFTHSSVDQFFRRLAKIKKTYRPKVCGVRIWWLTAAMWVLLFDIFLGCVLCVPYFLLAEYASDTGGGSSSSSSAGGDDSIWDGLNELIPDHTGWNVAAAFAMAPMNIISILDFKAHSDMLKIWYYMYLYLHWARKWSPKFDWFCGWVAYFGRGVDWVFSKIFSFLKDYWWIMFTIGFPIGVLLLLLCGLYYGFCVLLGPERDIEQYRIRMGLHDVKTTFVGGVWGWHLNRARHRFYRRTPGRRDRWMPLKNQHLTPQELNDFLLSEPPQGMPKTAEVQRDNHSGWHYFAMFWWVIFSQWMSVAVLGLAMHRDNWDEVWQLEVCGEDEKECNDLVNFFIAGAVLFAAALQNFLIGRIIYDKFNPYRWSGFESTLPHAWYEGAISGVVLVFGTLTLLVCAFFAYGSMAYLLLEFHGDDGWFFDFAFYSEVAGSFMGNAHRVHLVAAVVVMPLCLVAYYVKVTFYWLLGALGADTQDQLRELDEEHEERLFLTCGLEGAMSGAEDMPTINLAIAIMELTIPITNTRESVPRDQWNTFIGDISGMPVVNQGTARAPNWQGLASDANHWLAKIALSASAKYNANNGTYQGKLTDLEKTLLRAPAYLLHHYGVDINCHASSRFDSGSFQVHDQQTVGGELHEY